MNEKLAEIQKLKNENQALIATCEQTQNEIFVLVDLKVREKWMLTSVRKKPDRARLDLQIAIPTGSHPRGEENPNKPEPQPERINFVNRTIWKS